MDQQKRFTDLPQDAIDTVIFFLPRESIQALSQTCKMLHWQITNSSYVWQLLYQKMFGAGPTPYSLSKWRELFKERRCAGVYTWGANVGGRLGFSSNEVPPENITRVGFTLGVCMPTKVPGLENLVISDLSAGGFSIQLLNAKGEIYSLGSWHSGNRGPGPDNPDYNPLRSHAELQNRPPSNHTNSHIPIFRVGRRGGVRIGGINPLDQLPHIMPIGGPFAPVIEPPIVHSPSSSHGQQDKKENRFLSRQTTINQDDSIRFVSISSGRAHFTALDNSGSIWSWDDPRTNAGVKIIFKDNADLEQDLVSEGHKVLKCLSGWGSSVVHLYGYGLVYWTKRLEVKEDEYWALALHNRIPETGYINGHNRVVDFISGDSFIVYLTAGGKLYRNDMDGEESYELVKFEEKLKEGAMSLRPTFTRLSGNFNTFACFSNEDIVLMGVKDSDEPFVVDELQGNNCISLAVGDYHLLALLEDGTLLSWGLESNSCGCLGLGRNPAGSTVEGRSSNRVIKPTKVDTPGKVFAIGAAGWHSCAIISE